MAAREVGMQAVWVANGRPPPEPRGDVIVIDSLPALVEELD